MKNTFWKIILIGSLALLAACGGGTPAVEPKEIYVKADTGLDTNAGTLDKPLKTIKKALEVWKAGKELVLLPAIYNEVSGETWKYDAPAGLIIKSTASGVILESTAKTVAFNLSTAQIENINFRNFGPALVQNSGKQTLKGVTFESGVATNMTKSAEADWSSISFKKSSVSLSEASLMNLKGATFGTAFESISVAGSAQLDLENASTPDGPSGLLVNVSGSAKASVKTSNVTGLNSSFSVGGSGQLSLLDCGVTSTTGSTINVGGGSLSVKGGSFFAPNRSGIEAGSINNVNVSVDGTNINATEGISQAKGSLQVNNAQITTTRAAITSNYVSGSLNSLSVRNSVLTTSGSNSNVILVTFSGSFIDLGSAASPGGNTFINSSADLNPRTMVGISTVAGTTATMNASGNTWRPNVQGADAAGKYAAATVTGPSPSGVNYYVDTGITLKF